MKCYRCNNELDDKDEVCPKCGSKVIRYKAKEKVRVEKVNDENYGLEYYNFALGCLITKAISIFIAFIFPINLIIPWTLISLIFACVSKFKYKYNKSLIIMIIDIVLIIIEIVIFILCILFIKKLFIISSPFLNNIINGIIDMFK